MFQEHDIHSEPPKFVLYTSLFSMVPERGLVFGEEMLTLESASGSTL